MLAVFNRPVKSSPCASSEAISLDKRSSSCCWSASAVGGKIKGQIGVKVNEEGVRVKKWWWWSSIDRGGVAL